MFDLIEKLLGLYLAWLWFQVIAILVFVGGLFALAFWIQNS